MKRKMVPVEGSFRKWRKEAAYRKAYDALAGEFALARTFIAARTRAGMTQAQVAKRMGTTQAVIARLEMGFDYDELRDLLGTPTVQAARKAAERALVRLAAEMKDEADRARR